jgi:hypothetical protein
MLVASAENPSAQPGVAVPRRQSGDWPSQERKMAGAFLRRPFFMEACSCLLLFGRHFVVLARVGFLRDCGGVNLYLIPMQEER